MDFYSILRKEYENGSNIESLLKDVAEAANQLEEDIKTKTKVTIYNDKEVFKQFQPATSLDYMKAFIAAYSSENPNFPIAEYSEKELDEVAKSFHSFCATCLDFFS
jgi:ribosomal protein L11